MNRALGNLWDYHKRSNIHVFGVLEGEEKEGKLKSTQRNNDWKLSKFGKRHKPTVSRN